MHMLSTRGSIAGRDNDKLKLHIYIYIYIYIKFNVKIQRMLAIVRSGIFCLTHFNSRIKVKVKVKVKFTLKQTTKAQRG